MAKIYGNAVQGAADAFVQGSIQTALQGQTEQAFQVNSIEYEVVNPAVFSGALTLGGQDVEFSVAITRRSKTAMPLISDVDVIKKWKTGLGVWTAANAAVNPDLVGLWVPAGTVVLVEDPIYFQLDSTGTGVTIELNIAIDYDIVRISDIDRLTLLTQSLV